MKTFISIFIFSLILFDKASACDCGETPSIEDNWKYARQVFTGQVVDIDTSPHLYSARGERVEVITIEIIESFKLDLNEKCNLRTFIYTGRCSCDNNFDLGGKYLIYASGDGFNGFLESSMCSRTSVLAHVDGSEILQLRKLYQDLKKENQNQSVQIIYPDEIENYKLALLKSSNKQLSRDKRHLTILSTTLATVIILTLITSLIRRKKRTPSIYK